MSYKDLISHESLINLEGEYESGLTIAELAEKYKCSQMTIHNRLKSIGCEMRSKGVSKVIFPITDKKLKEEYESGLTTTELSEKYKCSVWAIIRILDSFQCKRRHSGGCNKLNLSITDKKLKEEYESGLIGKNLAEKYNCSIDVIYNRLKSIGCEMRSKKVIFPITDKKLKEEYESGKNSYQLAQKYDCESTCILNHLKSVGCKMRDLKGKNNPRYGKIMSEEARRKMSARAQGILYEEWEGYAKDHPYCPKFNESCRESNREKYDRKCFICGKPESENITKSGKVRKLSVHHCDMDRGQGCNGVRWKLIPLCLKHHGVAHSGLWIERITYLLDNISELKNS